MRINALTCIAAIADFVKKGLMHHLAICAHLVEIAVGIGHPIAIHILHRTQLPAINHSRVRVGDAMV